MCVWELCIKFAFFFLLPDNLSLSSKSRKHVDLKLPTATQVSKPSYCQASKAKSATRYPGNISRHWAQQIKTGWGARQASTLFRWWRFSGSMNALGGTRGERNAKPKFAALDINKLYSTSRVRIMFHRSAIWRPKFRIPFRALHSRENLLNHQLRKVQLLVNMECKVWERFPRLVDRQQTFRLWKPKSPFHRISKAPGVAKQETTKTTTLVLLQHQQHHQ